MTTLDVDLLAWRSLAQAARHALPRETGGLLLGHFTATGPLVIATPEVPDPRSTRIRYQRDARMAKRVLDRHMDSDGTGLLGYLGEWHSHPLPVGPSRTDLQAVRALAVDGEHDVFLLVAALGSRGWSGQALHATVAGDFVPMSVHVKGSLK